MDGRPRAAALAVATLLFGIISVGSASVGSASASPAPPTGTPQNMKIAVFMVNFANNRAQQYTAAQLTGALFTGSKSTARYWSESTGGAVDITGNVYGYYQLTKSSGDCTDLIGWMNDAKAMATRAGVDLSSYTNFQLWLPWTGACGGWSGIGEIGGSNTWIEAPAWYPDLLWAWPAHELGHNLNLLHSSTWSCHGVALVAHPETGCTHDEYGDPFDVMGAVWANGGRLATGVHRAQLGNLVPTVVTTSGTYTLAPAEVANPAQTQLLEIPRPDGSALSLEFRRPYGTFDTFAPSDPAVNGVTFHVTATDDGGRSVSHLIDMTPGDGTFADSSLRAGGSFTDPLTGRVIAVTAVTATGATVTIGHPPVRASVTGGVLNVAAGANNDDNITVTRSASNGAYIVDANNTITPGAGCVLFRARQVSCSNVTRSVIKTGNGNDTVSVNAGPQPTTVDGGTGNDSMTSLGRGPARLDGGAGNDVVTGGSGKDTLVGANGNDTIYAKDGNAEVVKCKAGNDTVTADPTDTLKGCEHIEY